MLIIFIIFSFSIITIMINKRINAGLAIMSGGITLSLLSGLTFKEIVLIIITTLSTGASQELLINVVLVITLINMMQEYGVMDKMAEYLEKLINNTKILLFVLPSLLSTFTAPGCAIVAAPILDGLGDKVGISQARKAAINLYIRHVWYFVLPVSIDLLNASYLAGFHFLEMAKAQAPITICCLIAGYVVYIAPIKNVKTGRESCEKRSAIAWKTLFYAGPLIVILIMAFLGPFYIALITGCLFSVIIKPDKSKKLISVFKVKNYTLVFSVACIIIFKNIIDSIPGLKVMIGQVLEMGIPIWAICIVLAFLLGYISGSVQVIVGTLYPLILHLVPENQVLATAVLIYSVGFTGYYISPIHLCQVLTNEVFGVSLRDLYREYRFTVPVIFLSGLLTYFIMR